MELDPRQKAQRRVDRIGLFRQELAELEQEQGLTLTPEQRSRLDAHLEGVLSALSRQFGVDATDSARRISWGMRLASLLGGAALVAAGVLFLHRIWGGLPTSAHVLILTTVPLLLLVGAEYAFRRGTDLYYPALLSLMAGVAFCVELNTLGNVMNLAPSPHALLAWASFAMLVAYAFGLRLLLAAGLLLLTAYTAALAMTARGSYWLGFMEESQFLLPAAAVLYALPWLIRHQDRPYFDFIYRLCGAFTGLTALLVLSKSGDLCCSALGPQMAEVTYQIVGLLLSAGVVAHGVRLGQGGLVNLGTVAFVVFLYVRLHAWFWDWMPKYLFFFLLGLTALVLLLIFRRLRTRLRTQP
jgi:uncharacterized membrane protein